MPGIDFDRLRKEITMEQVLHLLDFDPFHQRGDQWHGFCPLHDNLPKHRRSFSVNVALRRYYCHRCHSRGNQLDLWAAATKMSPRPAVIDLCRVLGREVPWIWRW